MYFGWSQTFWDDFVLHGVFFGDEKGDMILKSGATLPRIPKSDAPAFARDTGEAEATPCGYNFDYVPGTRRIQHATMQYRKEDGEILEVEYEPIISFRPSFGPRRRRPRWGRRAGSPTPSYPGLIGLYINA